MYLSVRLSVSEDTKHKKIELEDLGITEDEWNVLSEEERNEKLNDYIGDEPEQPYWVVDRYDETE